MLDYLRKLESFDNHRDTIIVMISIVIVTGEVAPVLLSSSYKLPLEVL